MSPRGAYPPGRTDAVVRHGLANATADGDLSGRDAALQRVCRAAAVELGITWCALHLSTKDGDWGVAAAADEESARVADLAFTTGEGPSLDAFTLRRPVLVGDLQSGVARWLGFTQAARELGVCAVFSFPLQIGGVRLGTLDLYCDAPRTLAADDAVLALAFSTLATRLLLSYPATESEVWEPLLDHRAEIHQAQGMVMVDLGVDLVEALVRMRAYAFAQGVPLITLARAIIAGLMLPDG